MTKSPATCWQLAAAGNETTRNAIAFGLHALLLRPEQMALLRAQGGMPESAVEEILRWASPTIHTVRLAKEDVTLHGETIRAGERVALLLSSANFDPRQFERPEDFNIMRAANDHVAFGTAAHTCLGLHVARLELKILFEELLRRAADRACRRGRVHSRQSGPRRPQDAARVVVAQKSIRHGPFGSRQFEL